MAERRRSGRSLRRLVIAVALVLIGVLGGLWAVGASGRTGPSVAARPLGPQQSPGPAAPTSTRSPDSLTVVGLGDSVPSAATCGCTGYLELLGSSLHLATQRPVVVHNDSTDGATSEEVEQSLHSDQTSADLSHADLVVVEVGANDFDLGQVDDPTCLPADASACWTDTMTGLSANLADIVSGIRDVDQQPEVRIALVGYWNVALDGDVGAALGAGYVSGSDALTRAVNATIAAVSVSDHVLYVDAYTPFKGQGALNPTSNLLDDGNHLNASGHAIMAKAVFDSLTFAGVVTAFSRVP